MFIEDIKTAPPFRELFPIQEQLLDRITWDMRKNGYDQDKPIVLWEGHNVIVDGHIRLRAARKAGLFQIPVVLKKFPDKAAALKYTISCQRNRRNLRDAELFQCIAAFDRKKTQGKRNNPGRSSVETAELLGVSHRKVERTRTVMNRAPNNIITAVKVGEMSINKAYELMRIPVVLPLRDKLAEIFASVTSRLDKNEISELITRLQEYLKTS